MKKRTKRFIILAVVIIVIVVIVVASGDKKDQVEYTTAQASISNLTQTVSEVGTLKAVKELELNFMQAGQVGNILVKTGDAIEKDQILAELDYSSLLIRERESKSNLDIATANRNKLIAGATRNEVAVSEAQVTQAQTSYSSALKDLEKIEKSVAEDITQAQKKLDDLKSSSSTNVTTYEQAITTAELNLNNTIDTYQQSINNYLDSSLTTVNYQLSLASSALDEIKTILDDTTAQPYLSVKNQSYLLNTESLHASALSLIATAKNSYTTAISNNTKENAYQSLSSTLDAVNKTYQALDNCYKALENSITSSSFSQTSLDNYTTTIIGQRTTVNTGISSIQTARQNLDSAYLSYQTNVSSAQNSLSQARVNLSEAITNAKNTLNTTTLTGEKSIATAKSKTTSTKEAWAVASKELTRLKSPARSEDVALAKAQVSQAESALNLIQQQIEDNIIRAPMAGQITDINYEIGEQLSLAKPIFKLLASNDYEIEVDVSESDINKVKMGNDVNITFDAFGEDEKFAGKIIFIEPAETIIQDVIYYKVKIELTALNEEIKKNIKPGTTVNTDIIAKQKENVLTVPSRAVIEKNGLGKFVRVLSNEELLEIPVEVGLRGDEGLIEIISGINSNDIVVTYIKEK